MNRKKYGELLEHAIEKAVELTCIQNSQYLNYAISDKDIIECDRTGGSNSLGRNLPLFTLMTIYYGINLNYNMIIQLFSQLS